MAILQGGDEVAKALLSDPEQSASSAVTNIGLAGLLGGAIGGTGHLVVEPLWLAVKGNSLTKALGNIKSKVLNEGLSSGTIPANVELLGRAEQLGVQVPPSIRAVLVGDEASRASGAALRESSSRSGLKYQVDLKAFEDSAKERALGVLGKTEDDLLGGLSDYERGTQARGNLLGELKAQIDPITSKFEPIREKFQSAKLPEGTTAQLAEDLGQLSVKEGYNLSESSPVLKEVNRTIEDLKNLKTLEDLRKYQAVARGNAGDINGYRLGKQIVGILREGEENALGRVMGVEAPELIAEHAAARKGYKEVMGTLDDLNDRLHVGKYWGPGSFLKNLGEMSPEDVLRRTRGLADADFLNTLSSRFPKTADSIREYHKDALLQKVTSQGTLDTRKLFRALDKMSPELRAFSLPAGAEEQLSFIRDILQELPARINPSGTAKALDGMMRQVPGGVGSMVSLALGHNPIMGYAIGHLSKEIGREAPDAAKLAFLRMLGSDAPASAGGYKSMFKFIESAYKGAQAVDKAAKAVFRPGAEVLANASLPTERQQKTIIKAVKSAQLDPGILMRSTGSVGHYLPEQATAMGSTVASSVTYLSSLQPNIDAPGILDGARVPNRVEKERFMRAVNIAQQPLLLLQRVKDGTLLPSDVQDIASMYPALYSNLKVKLLDSLSGSKGSVPYQTRMGLSMFLAQPLDSSMMPQNIAANQVLTSHQGQAQQGAISQARGSKTDFKGLDGLAQVEQTPLQSRTQRKSK